MLAILDTQIDFQRWGYRESGSPSYPVLCNREVCHEKKMPASIWTVPVTVDKEKKSLVVDKDSLRGLAPDFNRGEAVFERNTLKIVEINVFRNELLNF